VSKKPQLLNQLRFLLYGYMACPKLDALKGFI